ncbi:MAG: YggS family pyridoxal phosphate-dependent enzyme [Cryomorphaceae bacterium]|nr:MAG: YggS family pyridoxal phosphate-dependent enzyme [Cryomorphaceae bacterium]
MIASRLLKIREKLHPGVTLVAVSKTRSNEEIMQAYNAGQRVFGENRAQEMAAKFEELPGDIQWHMIGHLQRNKVKYIAPFVHLIHSVDSFRLLKEINKEAAQNNRVIPVLLQFHIAREDSKHGLQEPLPSFLTDGSMEIMKNVEIRGVMGMATFTDDETLIREEFRKLRSTFEGLKQGVMSGNTAFREISMGMSADFLLAQEEGSTMVRVGSDIFGERKYT